VRSARKPERQRRTFPGPRHDLERATGQPGPLAKQPEADVPTAVGLHGLRVEARALVGHEGGDPLGVDGELRAGVVDLGVLDDVEQRLLEEPVDGHGGDERKGVRRRRPDQLDLQGVARAQVVAQHGDRTRQVAVAQRGRPGARHDRTHLVLGLGDQLGGPLQLVRRGAGRPEHRAGQHE
jgi:hypothetical protein